MTTETSRVGDRIPIAAEPPPAIEEYPLTSPTVPPDVYPEIQAAVGEPAGTVGAEAGPQPRLEPGQVAAGVGETLGTITHLWSYDSPVGVWVYLDGIGWKRLSPASESGHTHMTVLSSLATNANIPVYYNLDGSGQIDRMYV
jgi:hypothetical protein